MSSSGLTRSIHRPHQQRQIARRRLDQQFLVHIPDTPDVEPVHSTRIESMREVPFDLLPPLPLHPLAPLSPNAPPVAIHRFFFCLLAIPVARSPTWFRDVKFFPPVRPSRPHPDCCGIPCPPPLLPLHQGAPHTCLRAVPPSPVPPPPRPLRSPSLPQSPCRRRLRHAW